ncbi:hypothetical protein B1A67_00605 [Clostridium botulinum D/C]|uniref:LamG domain-containing protein n=1 Tax=Clostridium botulinum TaxID=1491 RepID=UPI000992AA17|nr:LamG domain-containing protein [Clostridium botulinum]OOV53064.1 hypothetical protein B1A66_00560 [Clostridium botulinum D/C]OOV58368.1 hypothetical protein B0673_02710 [Clostridium botulinum D/C]OOV59569.1 hypothetical protein B1A67_00605 [Clostridium botulinum D/C]
MANKSLYFNGKDSEAIIKHKDFYNVFPFSIQCWIKTTQNNNNHSSIVNKYISGSRNGWSLNIKNGKISFWIYNNNNGCEFIGNTLISDNEWHNVIITVSNTVKVYIDGVLDIEVSSNINSYNTNSIDIVLGLYQGSHERYNGFLDDFSFWNIELDNSIIAKYSKGIRIDKNNNFLTGYWNMDKLVDNQIIDCIKKNNGTIKNLELISYGCPIEYYKFLLQQNNQLYTIKSEFYEPSKSQYKPITGVEVNNITDENLKKYGFDDIGDILKTIDKGNLNMLFTNDLEDGKQFGVNLKNGIKKIDGIRLLK